MRRRRDPVERFWSFVDKTGECWIWLGARNKNYGRFSIDRKTPLWAHRFSYELLKGPIPDGKHLDHLCRNPPCVNPAHLEPVTAAQNLARSPIAPATINSLKTHCPRGHEYAGDNVRRSRIGGRYCLACRREYAKRFAQEQIEAYSSARSGTSWTDEESAFLVANLDAPVRDLAAHLGRTPGAVRAQRTRLRSVEQ